MKTIFKLSCFIILTTILISGCRKYPDGPTISLLSKKERLSNTWYIASYYENGVDKTTDFKNTFENARLIIDKNGNYSLYYRAFGLVDNTETGTWSFSDDKKSFFTDPSSNSNATSTHHILKLKENELWYFDDTDSNGIKKEYHLKP